MDLSERPRVRDRPAQYAVLGVDVGKLNDRTVIAVVHPVEEWTGRTRHIGHEPSWGSCQNCTPELRWRHDVRGMETIPLGKPYPAQASRVVDLAIGVLGHPSIEWVFVPTDATGVGGSFVDALRQDIMDRGLERVYVVPVTIGSGEADACKGSFSSGRVWVSATALMSRLKSTSPTSDRIGNRSSVLARR